MSLEDFDFAGLGTAISILADGNPVTALATGLISGILGTAFFTSKKKKVLKERVKLYEEMLRKERENAKIPEQDSGDSAI